MYKLIITSAFFLCVSCSTGQTQNSDQEENTTESVATVENEVKKVKVLTVDDSEYNFRLEIIDQNSETPSLLITLAPKDDSHYISPLDEGSFKGKFYFDLGEYKNIEFKGEFKESPLSEDLFDDRPFVNDTVRWIRTKTTYQQELKIKTKENFQVFGRVQFVIEPRCTLEEIPFAIIYENGEFYITSPKC